MGKFLLALVIVAFLALTVNGQRLREMLNYGTSKTIQCANPKSPYLDIVVAVYASAPPAPSVKHPPPPCRQTDNFAAFTKLCNNKPKCLITSKDATTKGNCSKRPLMVTYQCLSTKSKPKG